MRGRGKVLGLVYVKLGTSGRWIGTHTGAGVHTTSMIKLFWSHPMAPWASAAA